MESMKRPFAPPTITRRGRACTVTGGSFDLVIPNASPKDGV